MASLSFKAANCWAAGLLPTFFGSAEGDTAGLDGCWRAAFTADAKESLEAVDSEFIVTGFDKGEGFVIRLAASVEDARDGMLINFGWSFRAETWSFEAFPIDVEEVEDGVGFAIIDPPGSRLVA